MIKKFNGFCLVFGFQLIKITFKVYHLNDELVLFYKTKFVNDKINSVEMNSNKILKQLNMI